MSVKELEERVMLNKSQYLEIKKYLENSFNNIEYINQVNHYLDDAKWSIKELKNTLRIRDINSKRIELTYKVKGLDGDYEYNQNISKYFKNEIIKKSHLPNGEVKNSLIKDNVDITSIRNYTSLATKRIEITLTDHIIVLDVNKYNGIIDYDLEIESVISKEHAKEIILKYCSLFNMEYKSDYITKSNRAFNSIKF